jgi:hypothetical protein
MLLLLRIEVSVLLFVSSFPFDRRVPMAPSLQLRVALLSLLTLLQLTHSRSSLLDG